MEKSTYSQTRGHNIIVWLTTKSTEINGSLRRGFRVNGGCVWQQWNSLFTLLCTNLEYNPAANVLSQLIWYQGRAGTCTDRTALILQIWKPLHMQLTCDSPDPCSYFLKGLLVVEGTHKVGGGVGPRAKRLGPYLYFHPYHHIIK